MRQKKKSVNLCSLPDLIGESIPVSDRTVLHFYRGSRLADRRKSPVGVDRRFELAGLFAGLFREIFAGRSINDPA